jgi:hypothetical protein
VIPTFEPGGVDIVTFVGFQYRRRELSDGVWLSVRFSEEDSRDDGQYHTDDSDCFQGVTPRSICLVKSSRDLTANCFADIDTNVENAM